MLRNICCDVTDGESQIQNAETYFELQNTEDMRQCKPYTIRSGSLEAERLGVVGIMMSN